MKELLTKFIADYLDKKTRGAAHSNLAKSFTGLEKDEVELLISSAMKFVEGYERMRWWPWYDRSNVIATSLRAFQ